MMSTRPTSLLPVLAVGHPKDCFLSEVAGLQSCMLAGGEPVSPAAHSIASRDCVKKNLSLELQEQARTHLIDAGHWLLRDCLRGLRVDQLWCLA